MRTTNATCETKNLNGHAAEKSHQQVLLKNATSIEENAPSEVRVVDIEKLKKRLLHVTKDLLFGQNPGMLRADLRLLFSEALEGTEFQDLRKFGGMGEIFFDFNLLNDFLTELMEMETELKEISFEDCN